MSLLVTAGVAFCLALDAFAASLASGFFLEGAAFRHALRVGAFFGGFQALMPAAGWLAGRAIAGWAGRVDRWIAFLLLAGVGCKMIWESFRRRERTGRGKGLALAPLLLLSLATSLDAFSVGAGFAFLRVDIFPAAAVIGGVTFCMSFAGVYMGGVVGHLFGAWIETAGGAFPFLLGVYLLAAG